ncbi:MAG: hypothetical protein ACOYI2_08635 [Bacillota bacterium]|jgi:stage III sporulation protein AG
MVEERKNNFLGILKLTKDQIPFIVKMVVAAFIGILVLNLASMFQKPTPQPEPFSPIVEDNSVQKEVVSVHDEGLEDSLERILGEIAGVGKVSVSVVYAEGPTREYAVNVSSTERETEEKDQAGGVRITKEITQNGEVVMLEGNQQPVMVKESMPKIQGVLVVADGVKDPLVKEKLFKAVQGLLQVPAHRITVYTRGGM